MYQHLLKKAQLKTKEGDNVIGNKVYYVCRVECSYSERIRKDRQRYYLGKINGKRATCLPVDNPAIAIHGKSAEFRCDIQPGKLTVFQGTSAHRARWGILEKNVKCWIKVSFYPTQPNSSPPNVPP